MSLFSSCSDSKKKPIIIWTNSTEFASYIEYFNSTHSNAKAVLVYKEQPAHSLPPQKDEAKPDIIIGSWLKNSTTRKYFTPLDYLFLEHKITKSDFYNQLIEYGSINDKQYLIPVSFNIPAMIFSAKNESLIENDHLLNLDQIKTTAGNYNKTNKDSSYAAMGYAPSWDSSFLYLAAKLQGASFREKGNSFSWDSKALMNTVSFIKDWTTARNTDTSSEQNFEFKYLYMPKYRQINTDRCLFAFMNSDELLTLTEDQSTGISFRWIEQNGKIPVNDEIITMGIYKHAKNTKQAELFIEWITKEATQRELIQRTEHMDLDTITFGIANGFSSIKSVNEKIFPTYYRQLLGNLPASDYLTVPNILPYRWPLLVNKVIIPYLTDSTNTAKELQIESLEDRIAEWNRTYF